MTPPPHFTWKEVQKAVAVKAVIRMQNERGEERSIGAASMSVRDVAKALRLAERGWIILSVERED